MTIRIALILLLAFAAWITWPRTGLWWKVTVGEQRNAACRILKDLHPETPDSRFPECLPPAPDLKGESFYGGR